MKNYLVVLGPSTNCLHESEYIWNGFFIDKRILGPVQYTKFSCNIYMDSGNCETFQPWKCPTYSVMYVHVHTMYRAMEL